MKKHHNVFEKLIVIILMFLPMLHSTSVQAKDIKLIPINSAYSLKIDLNHYQKTILNSGKYQNNAVAPNVDQKYWVYVANKKTLLKPTKTALKMWHKKTNLSFHLTNSSEKAQIRIKTANLKPHYLGTEQTVLYKYSNEPCLHPVYGNIKIDRNHIQYYHTNCAKVVAHEIGHALGLRHNKDTYSIMNAYANHDKITKITSYDAKIAKKLHNTYLAIKQS